MEQAYSLFNSGKYKEALNTLAGCSPNVDSFEPNLAVCECLTNRGAQSILHCLRRLSDFLARRTRKDSTRLDVQTEALTKLNITVLLLLMGRREAAYLVLQKVYAARNGLIEFLQSRIFFLLMELNIALKNPLNVLQISRDYVIIPSEQRAASSQWVSVILHEHGRAHAVAREEFQFMSKVLFNQALIQLGVDSQILSTVQDDQQLKKGLLMTIKTRKNNVSKCYEINVAMIARFLQAQKEMHRKNYSRCLSLMNFVNIVGESEQMPSTKIISNTFNAFATSNSAMVYCALGKPLLALQLFLKAKGLLSKACTGVEDKDLQLFSLNYANFGDSISLNTALALLISKPKDSLNYFEAIRKSNLGSRNYKFWYRLGQATLEHVYGNKMTPPVRRSYLSSALNCFAQCLACIERVQIPSPQFIAKYLPILAEDQIECLSMRLNGQLFRFRQSALTLHCFVAISLDMPHRVIKIIKRALSNSHNSSETRVVLLHYAVEAYLKMERYRDAEASLFELSKESEGQKGVEMRGVYMDQHAEESNVERLLGHKMIQWHLREGRIQEAWVMCQRLRLEARSPSISTCAVIKYLHYKAGLDSKFVRPYLQRHDQF